MNPPTLARDTGWLLLGHWLKLICALLLTTGMITGCQTHKIDWQSRVGVYTYDEVVKEMGPPDKSATLTDGTLVCEWLTNRGSDGGTVISSGFYGLYTSTSPGSPDAFLRLTFNPDKKLTEAKRVYK